MNAVNHKQTTALAILLFLATPAPIHAEVVTDGSMGAALDLPGPNFAITEDLGTRAGANLFHSFDRFSIAAGESATFSSLADSAPIDNVIGRVTGGITSNIDGTLRSTIPNAGVYLVNPAGVIFGANATLDVDGSFHASSADYLRLGATGRYDVSNPGNTLLASAPPSAFGFLDVPAGISLDHSVLEVADGRTLTLAGGDIAMQDATLHAPQGHIHLASVASAGEAVMTADGIDTSNFAAQGTIEIRHEGNYFRRRLANLDTSGDSGGVIKIRAGQFIMDNGLIFADNAEGAGGQVDIQTTETVILKNESLATADTFGSGGGGTIEVSTVDVVLQDGGIFQTDNYGPADGGTLTLNASGTVSMAGESIDALPYIGNIDAGLYARSFGSGNGGTINVNAPRVVIGADSKIELNASFNDGNAGTLYLNAGTLQMNDGGIIQTDTFGAGNAGTVNINVESAIMTGGSSIAATTRGTGSGGVVMVTAADSVHISGSNDIGPSGVFTNTFNTGNGGTINIVSSELAVTNGAAVQSAVSGVAATAATMAGNIDIDVTELVLSGQGQLSTQSENAGQAGTITVKAMNAVNISSPDDTLQSGIFSTTTGSGGGGNIDITAAALDMNGGAVNVSSSSTGDAGAISLNLERLDLNNGGQVSTSVAGDGNGGTLVITASGNATVSGESASGFSSGLYSTTAGGGTGGDIGLAANNVTLNTDGVVTAESTGSGNAGNILVSAADSVNILGGAIRTRAVTADGGNIKIDAPGTVYLPGGEITTSVESGEGDGGNINIDPAFVILNDGRIIANAFGGNGGNILIVTDNFIATPDSVVNASSQLGLDGTVIIKSPESDLSSSITDLPESFLDVAALLSEPCAARRSVRQSSFIVRGRDVIPPGPLAPLPPMTVMPGASQPISVSGLPSRLVMHSMAKGIRLKGLATASGPLTALNECSLQGRELPM